MSGNIQITKLTEEIFDLVLQVGSADLERCLELKVRVLEITRDMSSTLSRLARAGALSEDPEFVVQDLIDAHYLNAAVLGLVATLYRRLKFLWFRRYKEDGGYVADGLQGPKPSRRRGGGEDEDLEMENPDALPVVRKYIPLSSAQDREYYAKGETSELEGLISFLSESQRNIYERMQIFKGNIRRV